MPEQFSEEYVAEVRKYPWLQEMWQPEPPDLFWIDGNIFVITFVSELGDVDAKCICGPVIGLAHYRSDSQFFQARQRGDIVWLPTLGELVRELQKQGIGYQLTFDIEGQEHTAVGWKPIVEDESYLTEDFGPFWGDDYDEIAIINLLAAVREEADDD